MEIEEMRKKIQELNDGEAKSLLFQIFLRMNLLKETEYSREQFLHDVENIYKTIDHVANKKSELKKEESFKRVHILFGASPAGSLKVALKKMRTKEEKVLSFWDMFSIGPVWKLHETPGEESRFDWIKTVMNAELEEFQDYKQQFQNTVHQIMSIPEDVPIILWVAENAHEQTGLRYVLHLLKNKPNEIQVLNTTELYAEHFHQPDIIYTVLHTGEIPPEKLQVIYAQSKSNSLLSQQERENLEQEWLSLAENKKTLRIWRDGRIKCVDVDYFDQFIITKAKELQIKRQHKGEADEFMKSARIIGEVLGYLEQYVGDSFLEYRLRKLIEKDIFEVEGSLKAMRFYSVRLKR
ncbi:DUF1835 domain-containing protein [Mesobacillus maritimus]|uniref:DUF1835 domain-containing protein n=1 Tax=Mesobacillus maritimus TaxID=1643336 RepID=A0ABS7K7S5_9BACI|nr:DUF1835 domain-containing protein [Mesobacillus maritimus]MBY0098327.1 DUF1835 domain-containing protein [Mesobacillus maritimus]